MVDTTRIPRVGSDSWWRSRGDSLDDMRNTIKSINRGIGANGFTFSTQSLVIKGDGQIVGEGTGALDWNGPAHFGGNTTIDGDTDVAGTLNIDGNTTISGTLDIGAGLIGGSALASQISSDLTRVTNTSYSVPTNWGSIATANISRPSWATEVTLMMVGQVQWVINESAGSPYGRIRIAAPGTTSFDQITIGGSFKWVTATVSWAQKITSPPSNFNVSLQAKADAGMFTATADTTAVLSVQSLFLR